MRAVEKCFLPRRQIVQADDVVSGREQGVCEMTSDEAGGTRDQEFHERSRPKHTTSAMASSARLMDARE